MLCMYDWLFCNSFRFAGFSFLSNDKSFPIQIWGCWKGQVARSRAEIQDVHYSPALPGQASQSTVLSFGPNIFAWYYHSPTKNPGCWPSPRLSKSMVLCCIYLMSGIFSCTLKCIPAHKMCFCGTMPICTDGMPWRWTLSREKSVQAQRLYCIILQVQGSADVFGLRKTRATFFLFLFSSSCVHQTRH